MLALSPLRAVVRVAGATGSTTWCGLLAILALAIAPAPASAQQVLLDEPVDAGGLTLYPTLGSDLEAGSDYYYVPDRARLAEGEGGRPEFSFLRYVDNVRPEAGEDVAREGDGGGIVHAVVQLYVDDSTLREAERELARLRPGARIVGPVIYRSGTFGLVSSFLEEDGELTRRVVGLGKAPVLEGSRAAISMRLTKQGSQILWESFEMAQSDVSFVFDMEIEGLRAPVRARLEADWDRIYQHRAFQAAVAAPLLAAEVSAAFDELRTAGAIRLVQVGSDEQMERAVQVAYDKLATLMLEPVDGTGTPSLDQLAGGAGGPGSGLLDRATGMLAAARAEAGGDPGSRPTSGRDTPRSARPGRADASGSASDDGGDRDRQPERAGDVVEGGAGGEVFVAPPPSARSPEGARPAEELSPDSDLTCDLRFAYWTMAEIARAEELRRILASRVLPLIEQRLPAQIAEVEAELQSLPPDADSRAHEQVVTVFELSAAHWSGYAEALEHWIPRRIEALERDRRLLESGTLRTAANDPQVAQLGRARARLEIDRQGLSWIEEMQFRLRELRERNEDLGPAARGELASREDSLRSAHEIKRVEYEQSERDAAELERARGRVVDRSAEECPDLPPDLLAEPTDPYLAEEIESAELRPMSELLDEIERGMSEDEAGRVDGDPVARSGGARTGGGMTLVDDPAADSIGAEDFWIVSMGDSFSSGEGNPTVTGVPINDWKWMDDEKCHRSRWGWPHLVAEFASEVVDAPVRFTFLACSGGKLKEGLLESYTERNVDREPQLDRLQALVDAAGRVPDVVLLTGGGNDIGFSDIVKECVTPLNCPGGEATELLEERIAVLVDDDESEGLYTQVAKRLDRMGVPRDRVILMLYPNPLFGRKRSGSGWGPYEVQAGCYIPAGPRMWTWATEQVVVPLQQIQQERAATLGWRLAEDHLAEFEKHSYCPRDSFRGGDSWWVGILSQIVKQWGLGAFHPNRRGHRELARAALVEMGEVLPEFPRLDRRGAAAATAGAGTVGSNGAGEATPPTGAGTATSSGRDPSATSSPRRSSFAAVGALQLRRTRQEGTFQLEMNKYMAGSQVINFAQPIGDLARYKADETVFREVNLDQPLFRQREVAFRLDGLDAEDFGEFVNFVHVQLRRGEGVREELTIGPEQFNARGHDFRLVYGFSGEESRDDWVRYEYRAVWSLFDGLSIDEDWQASETGAVALAPPYVRRTVELEGDPSMLEGVRAITVRLYYSAGGEERFSEALLRTDRGIYVATADVLLPVGETTYEYEVLWHYGSQRTLGTGRLETSQSLLFLDPPAE